MLDPTPEELGKHFSDLPFDLQRILAKYAINDWFDESHYNNRTKIVDLLPKVKDIKSLQELFEKLKPSDTGFRHDILKGVLRIGWIEGITYILNWLVQNSVESDMYDRDLLELILFYEKVKKTNIAPKVKESIQNFKAHPIIRQRMELKRLRLQSPAKFNEISQLVVELEDSTTLLEIIKRASRNEFLEPLIKAIVEYKWIYGANLLLSNDHLVTLSEAQEIDLEAVANPKAKTSRAVKQKKTARKSF